VEEGERIVIAIFPVFREAAASIKPCDGAFDDPTLGFYDEALGLIASPDDLVHEIGHDLCDAVGEDRPGIGAVGEQLAQERELPKQLGQQQNTTVAVLNVGGGHQRVQHQAQCIDEDMTLLALDQLAGIEAMRVDARAPFSAPFTLWLSMTQAVGLASRSACSRHLT
jgi:hypothetical protein